MAGKEAATFSFVLPMPVTIDATIQVDPGMALGSIGIQKDHGVVTTRDGVQPSYLGLLPQPMLLMYQLIFLPDIPPQEKI